MSFIRKRGTKAEITALRLEQASLRTTVASVPVPLALVEGAEGGVEALGILNLRVTAASPTQEVVGTSNQENARS